MYFSLLRVWAEAHSLSGYLLARTGAQMLEMTMQMCVPFGSLNVVVFPENRLLNRKIADKHGTIFHQSFFKSYSTSEKI